MYVLYENRRGKTEASDYCFILGRFNSIPAALASPVCSIHAKITSSKGFTYSITACEREFYTTLSAGPGVREAIIAHQKYWAARNWFKKRILKPMQNGFFYALDGPIKPGHEDYEKLMENYLKIEGYL